MWQLIISMPLKSMEDVQLILSQIWAPRMGSWPPYKWLCSLTCYWKWLWQWLPGVLPDVCGLCGLEQPNDWKQAHELYNILLQFAQNGSTWHDPTEMSAFWNDFEPFIFFFQDRGGSLYLGGSRFAKSITSKLMRDFFRHWFNTMELWRDLPKQSCWYFTFLFKLNVKVTV